MKTNHRAHAGCGRSLIAWIAFAGAMALGSVSAQAQTYNQVYVLSSGNGSITSPAGAPPATVGAFSTLTATPAVGYMFGSWETTVGASGLTILDTNAASTSLTLFGPTNSFYQIVAHFRPLKYHLDITYAGTGSGNVDLSPPAVGANYAPGTPVTLTAQPGGGSTFTSWSGDASGTVSPTTVTMSSDKSVQVAFTSLGSLGVWLYSQIGSTEIGNPQLQGSGFSGGPTNVPYGSLIWSSVTSPFVDPNNTGIRYIAAGFDRTGSSPTNTTTGAAMTRIPVTANTTINWKWNIEYFLRVKQSAGGTVSVDPSGVANDDETGFWYSAGDTVNLTAIPETLTFLKWGDDVSGESTTNSIVMTGPKTVSASFGDAETDQDGDNLPDAWELKFGLLVDKSADPALHGEFGDPDNDGLPNILEWRISHQIVTNALKEASPINADSDGDGMDDGYEYQYMMTVGGGDAGDETGGGAGIGTEENARAVVTPTGPFGPDANLDEDFHWNTATGYKSLVGLTAIEEYISSDTNVPGFWQPAVIIPTMGLPVNRFTINPGDTGDQTFPNSTDSEIVGASIDGDGFDDGFEYSWDMWQGVHGGDPNNDPLGRRVPYRWGNDPQPVSAAIANFNQDTDANNNEMLDLAVANYGHNSISIMLGAGGGAFNAPAEAYSSGSGPRCIMAGDFLGDGSADDLVVANELSNNLTILLSAGDGTFTAAANVSVGTAPSYIAVGDFDGGGTTDLAVTCEGSHDVYVLPGNGDGTFGAPQILALAGAGPVCIVTGDTDGGTGDDLVIANGGDDSWEVWLNDGTGLFALLGQTLEPAGSQPSCIALVDIDGTGVNDVVLTTQTDDRVRTYYGNGDGTFTAPAVPNAVYDLSTATHYGPKHFAVGYFDAEAPADGADIAVANVDSDPANVSVVLYDASELWTPGSAYDVESTPVWVLVARLGEVKGDKTDDLIIIQRDEPGVVVAFGRGDGTFLPSVTYDPTYLAVDRRFHPAEVHTEPMDGGRRDYDLQYDPISGGSGDWLSDDMEYNAWDVPLSILRREFPDRERCSHPFSWDADRDNMPDGWEMAFGYDPWDPNTDDDDRTDDAENDDGDWYAFMNAGTNHHAVYIATNFNPYTGYTRGPFTAEFTNYEELVGPRGLPALTAHDPLDNATHPHNRDSDGDGIWDGWEWYVNLNPRNVGDGGLDAERDGLSNFEEFDSYATPPTNGLPFGGTWLNKRFPTDPNDRDTDFDQISDSGERAQFNYTLVTIGTNRVVSEDSQATTNLLLYGWIEGGGLCPTTCDTDGDHLPDYWEQSYAGALQADGTWSNGMNGAAVDHQLDYDGDGLLNYQEYMCGAVYMWQFQYNNGAPAWQAGKGIYNYEPYDFFDERLSGNDAMTAGGGRVPKYWDPLLVIGPLWHRLPFKHVTAAEPTPFPWLFSSTDPTDADTDLDGMDDYWEVFHGLNPLFGILDVVRTKVYGVPIYTSPALPLDQYNFPITGPVDVREYPWFAGCPFNDSDQDELPNIFESLQADVVAPEYYHTDPSPLWMTDTASTESFVSLFYWLGNVFGGMSYPAPYNYPHWWWDALTIQWGPHAPPTDIFAPPSYLFSFESNEGYDTDNDNLADRAELVDDPASPGVTDVLEGQSPIKRRALYLNGDAAARTLMGYFHGANLLRTYTVEMWVRPENPASGSNQILIERPGMVPQGNVAGWFSGLRTNFRVGIDGSGRPYAEYNGAGQNYVTVVAKAAPAARLLPNNWVHLACTYSGDYHVGGYWSGKLTLYVNGVIAAVTPSSEIPFNGWVGALTPPVGADNLVGFFATQPIVVGAGDNNPSGWPHNNVPPVGVMSWSFPHSQPDLHSQFQGWVDQVHVWNQARTQASIKNAMFKRYTRQEVQGLSAGTNNVIGMLYAFSFDDLPDPDWSPVSPVGFDSRNGRPAAYSSVLWWANAPDRSQRYNDYQYIPWIENLAGHVASTPPFDSEQDIPVGARFPNTSNPYNYVYRHAPYLDLEFNPDAGGALTARNAGDDFLDLLPLDWAVADEDVLMWDEAGTGRGSYDTDGDRMPDWWEETHGLDPRDPTGVNGPDADQDDDGLTNLEEYYAGTDPTKGDTDGNGVGDADEDSDGDGLSNKDEFAKYGTLPNNMDTDDDGVTDKEEITGAVDASYARPASSTPPETTSDPRNSRDPAVRRSMYFDGNARLIVPSDVKYATTDWGIEMWVKPEVQQDCVLLRRHVTDPIAGDNGVNYEMGLSASASAGYVRPYIRHKALQGGESRLDGLGAADVVVSSATQQLLIPVGQWTHLAGTYDSTALRMDLYVNGELVAYNPDATAIPALFYQFAQRDLGHEVTIGASRSTGAVTSGFRGWLDNVAIHNAPLTTDTVMTPFFIPDGTNTTITTLGRSFIPSAGVDAGIAALSDGATVHAVVQFAATPTPADKSAMQAAGIEIQGMGGSHVAAVKATKAALLTPDMASRFRYVGKFAATDKLSKRLGVTGSKPARDVLVSFFPDVSQVDALAVASAAGVSVHGNAFLAGKYMVVSADDAKLLALANDDRVSWAAPSAAHLTSGQPVYAFDDASLPFETLGVGWDGPGLGSAALTYYFINSTADLGIPEQRRAIADMAMEWSKYAAITWAETMLPNQDFSMDCGFFVGAHGDGADFDGPGGVLAHGFFPNDLNPEPIAGDLHFDDDETWTMDASGISLPFVALHEIGHGLGMGHSDDPGAIMFPFYNPNLEPTPQPDDIDGIQTLYGKPVTTVAAGRLAFFYFNDGGTTAEDFTQPQDWLENWKYAAVLDGATSVVADWACSKDSDGDLLPDWWEELYGLDPNDAGDPHGSDGDPDGDGLDNYHEYLAGTAPQESDTDGDGLSDYNEDSDGDGLSNGSEQDIYGTNPGSVDSDDDGLSDKQEVDQALDPALSSDPYVMRYIHNDGSGWISIPGHIDGRDIDGSRFDLPVWTIEAAVRMDSVGPEGAVVIRRKAQVGTNEFVTFELGIAADHIPYAYFETDQGDGYRVNGYRSIQTNEWCFLSGRFGSDERVDGHHSQLALFHNGIRTIRDVTDAIPALGPQDGDLIVATDFAGDIDEIRVWKKDLKDDEVLGKQWRPLLFGSDVARLGSLQVGGAGSLERHAVTNDIRENTWTVEAWFKVTDTGIIVAREAGIAHDNETIYNYRLAINADGSLEGTFDVQDWLKVTAGTNTLCPVSRWGTITVAGSIPVNDGDWHHAAFTFDGVGNSGPAVLYRDGELVNSVNLPLSIEAIDWHLPGEEDGVLGYSDANICQPAPANHRRAMAAGSLLVGEGQVGLLDEIGIHSAAAAAAQIAVNWKKGATGPDLITRFSFDDVEVATPQLIPDELHTEALFFGTLTGDAVLRVEVGGNAPVDLDPLSTLAPKLAGYWPFDDGRWTNRVDMSGCVEDFTHRGDWTFAGSLRPDESNIDFAQYNTIQVFDPSNPFSGYEPAMAYPNPFSIPFDAPFRLDSDGDGLSDMYEQYYGLDPNRGTVPGVPEASPLGDMDGDGLVNLYEYYAMTDPTFHDSDGNQVDDGEEDSDTDGLSNLDEQELGTHPGQVDTDDDGITDEEESRPLLWANPADSMDPRNYSYRMVGDPRFEFKSMVLDGRAHEVPMPLGAERRFNSEVWTLECWVNATNQLPSGALISYIGSVYSAGTRSDVTYYELGLSNGVPYVAFQGTEYYRATSVSFGSVPLDQWVHVAGVFDPVRNFLGLYLDGKLIAELTVFERAMSGSETADKWPGRVFLGGSEQRAPRGYLDEVRVWSVARTPQQIADGMFHWVQLDEPGQICNFRFDDGRYVDPVLGLLPDGYGSREGKGAEDFVHRISHQNLESAWSYALRDITFAPYNAHRVILGEFDDLDRDYLADSWEAMMFKENLTYYQPQRVNGVIVDAIGLNHTMWGFEDPAFNANYLGWTIAFTPIETVPTYRWSEAPDAAWMIKDCQVATNFTSVEMRLAIEPGGTNAGQLVYINGVLLDLSMPGITDANDTFNIPGNTTVDTFYVPSEVLAGYIHPGRNRLAVQMLNLDGATSDEYFSLELVVDGETFVIGRGDDRNVTNSELSRWWVFSAAGTMAPPPRDSTDLAWLEKRYAFDLVADSDGDNLPNAYESVRRMNPRRMDSDGDGVLDADSPGSICGGLCSTKDSDSDGLPDDWEVANGLDPHNSTGANGALGNPDLDELPNLFEYIAGTDPQAADVFGLHDKDEDGLPDTWEVVFGLDKSEPTGRDGAYGDPDHDGLINLYEFIAVMNDGHELNPFWFGTDSANTFSDYYASAAPNSLTFGEIYDDTDLLPDGWEKQWPMILDRHYYHRDKDPDHDEWNNQEEYLAGTDPNDPASAPRPVVSGRIQYLGADPAGALRVFAYPTADMDTEPLQGTVTSVDGVHAFTFTTNMPGRSVWLFAYKGSAVDDGAGDDSGEGIGFVSGDAYGIAGPIEVPLDGASDIVIPVLDQTRMPWYQAFEWPVQTAIPQVYVRIRDENAASQLIMTRWINTDRSFFHAIDYQRGTASTGRDFSFGLPPGTYKWQVASNDLPDARYLIQEGTFNVLNYAVPTPEIVSPSGGDIVVHQLHDFSWRTDVSKPMPRFDLYIIPVGGAWTYLTNVSVQASDTSGLHTLRLPLQDSGVDLFGHGRWTSGQYEWGVRAHNNGVPGTWSTPRRFQIAVTNAPPQASGAPQISGNVMYYGKAPSSNIIVQAQNAPGFNGRVEGQVTVGAPGSFVLQGLRHVTYSLVAFIDLDRDGIPDEFEPQGMARDSSLGAHFEYRADEYGVGKFSLAGVDSITGVSILIRDRDTDNDNIMDGWEWENLHNSPNGMNNTGADDLDGDGLSNLQEYGLDSNPRVADSDGDGLSDGDEVNIYGTSSINSDSDGDTLGDSVELAMGLNPTKSDDDDDGVPTAMEAAWDGVAGSVSAADMNPGRADTDGDTVVDLMEVASGSDPVDASESEVIAITGVQRESLSAAILSWNVGRNNRSIDVTYIVEYSADMVTWTAVGELTSNGDAPATLTLTDNASPATGGFYRLRLEIR